MSKNKTVRYGSFLIVPLKYTSDLLKRERLEEIGCYERLTTMDVNENIKAMFDRSNKKAIGACYKVACAQLVSGFCGEPESMSSQSFSVTTQEGVYDFALADSYLYLFHTNVAFLCLNLSFSQMETMKAICNPGFGYNSAVFHWIDQTGKANPLSVEDWLKGFCASLGLQKFFDGDSSFLLDAYAYLFALVPERFETLEEMQKITFNLHKMMPVHASIEDMSEEDIRYVYAAKNQTQNNYRWGCCVTSQTIAYVIADESMDFEAERMVQANDGLPVVLLALYEKYTCLRFTEMVIKLDKKQLHHLKELKDMMLEFRAFGTVMPANLSRWHNVKQIYAYLLEVCDTASAIEDISGKLTILTEHQDEIQRSRSETVVNIITIFGIVSILASVLSIVQMLSGGDIVIWTSTILTAAVLILITILALRNQIK